MIRRPPRSTLFPYTNALPIFLQEAHDVGRARHRQLPVGGKLRRALVAQRRGVGVARHLYLLVLNAGEDGAEDRKSTRLNSSHLVISYAVFCLKKKKYHRHAM